MADPDTPDLVDAFCRELLGSPVERVEFHATSVGDVHGLRLADGRRVVVKVHRPHVDRAHLAAVQQVQRRLVAAGFPAPEPLHGPTALGAGVAIAESLLDEGEWADAHEPAVRSAVASELARLVALGRPLVDIPGLGRLPDATQRLWAIPHDPRFDFPGTAHGAEWIDRLRDGARRELERWAAGELVVGHADWRVEHLRFAAGRLAAAYDWDSLTVAREPEIAGAAAHRRRVHDSRKSGHKQIP